MAAGDPRQIILDLLKLFSVKIADHGEEFTLASGQKSKFYIDVKKTALHPRAHEPLAKLLYDTMRQVSFGAAEGAAGVALGGCHLASIVALYAMMVDEHPLRVFFVRKQAKEYGTKSLVEGPPKGPEHRVVLLEDVVTTGGSSVKAIQQLKADGCTVLGTIAVIDRRPKMDRTTSLGGLPFQAIYTLDDFDDTVQPKK
jgi:orotate phosphoribosyltransferase